MTTISARREQIVSSLHDKEYRDLFFTEEIDTGVPFQVRAMRQARGWSQKELAARLGMTQEGVSRLENPNYGKLTLTTLKRLASAFDVALSVRLVPFSQLVDWAANLSPEDLAVPDYEHDAGLSPAYVGTETTQTTGVYPYMRIEAIGPDMPSIASTPVSRIRRVTTAAASSRWDSQTVAPSDFLLAQTGD